MDFGGLPWKSQASDEDLWTQVDVSAPSRLGSQGADITSGRMTTYSEDPMTFTYVFKSLLP